MPARPAETPAHAARPDLRPVVTGDGGPVDLGLGADVVPLPSELVHILRVPLPLASHRQRQAAVGFAVEELIAEPLEASHVVLGPEVGRGEYLVVVVAHREMAAWAGRAAPGQRLVPDVLALPVPGEGCCSVREAGGRVLVRRADGTGYATRAEHLEAFWRADGAPQVVLYGGRLPEPVPVGAPGLMPAAPTLEAARLDLLEGAHARAGRGGRRLLTRLLAVLALALVAHGAVLAADVFALRRIAEAREAALRSALSERLPDLPASLPLHEALARAMPAPAARGGFLPLLARVAEVLGTEAEVTVRDLGYSAEDGGLSLSVAAPDLGALQRAEDGLRGAGLAVSAGVATTGDGSAEVQYRITGGGG
jgi:general secretion pathway protein L